MVDTSAIAALGDVPKPENFLDLATKYQHIKSQQTLQALQEQETQNQRANLASHLQGALGGWTYAWGNDPDMSYQKAQDQMNLVRTQNPQLGPMVDALNQRLRPDMSPGEIRQTFRNFGFASEKPSIQQQMNDPTTHLVTINGVTFAYTVPRAGNQAGQAPIPGQTMQPVVAPVTVEGNTDEQGRPKPLIVTPSWGGQGGGGGGTPTQGQPGVRSSDGTTPNPSNPPRLNGQPSGGGGGNAPPPPTDNGPPISAGAAIAGSGPQNLPVPPVPPAQPPVAAPPAPPTVAASPPPDRSTPSAPPPATPPPAASKVGPLASNNPLFAQPIPVTNASAEAQPSLINRLITNLNPIGTAKADQVGPIPFIKPNAPGPGAGSAPQGGGYGLSADQKAGVVASTEKLKADDTASTTYLSQRLPFEESLRNYDGGNVVTGPMTSFINSVEGAIRGTANRFGLPGDSIFPANEKIDAIKKWESNIATTSGFAGHSVAHLEATLEGNANTNINEQAAIKMLKTGVAMRNASYALNQQWHAMSPQDQWNASPQHTYLGYLQQAQRSTDLRAFALPYLSEKEQQNLITQVNKMTPEEQASFRRSMHLAETFTPSSGAAKPLPQGQ